MHEGLPEKVEEGMSSTVATTTTTTEGILESNSMELDPPRIKWEANGVDGHEIEQVVERCRRVLQRVDSERLQALLRYQFELEQVWRRRELLVLERRLEQVWRLLERPGALREELEAQRRRLEAEQRREFLYARLQQTGSGGQQVEYVRVKCPVCGKERFQNKLGFVNHCRILHRLKFATWDDAALFCGVPVPETEVPLDDPSRLQPPILRPAQHTSLHQNPHALAQQAASARARGDPDDADAEERSEDASSSESAARPPPRAHELSEADPDADPDESSSRAGSGGHDGDGDVSGEEREGEGEEEEAAAAAAAAAATGTEDAETAYLRCTARPTADPDLTRFHVRRRLLVGNTCERLRGRTDSGDRATHKWLLYVRLPPEEAQGQDPDLAVGQLVRRVRFFLHQSYRPNHVVELTRPPFQLCRRGWGEFPVRLQLHFVAPEYNHPLDIVHPLRLVDSLAPGVQMLGHEAVVEIHLDRRTLPPALLTPSTPTPAPTPAPAPMPLPAGSLPSALERELGPGAAVLERPEVRAVLEDAVARLFPVVRAQAGGVRCAPYTVAVSEAAWAAYSPGKRRAIEWQRARALHRLLLSRLPACPPVPPLLLLRWCRLLGHTPRRPPPLPLPIPPDEPPEILHAPTSPYLLLNSRATIVPSLGSPKSTAPTLPSTTISPALSEGLDSHAVDEIQFCRYCGLPHLPISQFSLLQEACGRAQHTQAPSSLTSAGSLLGSHTCPGHPSLSHFISYSLPNGSLPPETVIELSWVHTIVKTVMKPLHLLPLDPLALQLLQAAVIVFSRSLLRGALRIYLAQRNGDPPDSARLKILVPTHLFQYIISAPMLTFLTNGMNTFSLKYFFVFPCMSSD
jgi:hypothetical protein